jgi:LysM repeat protein
VAGPADRPAAAGQSDPSGAAGQSAQPEAGAAARPHPPAVAARPASATMTKSAANANATAQEYQVRSGDTLSGIAEKTLGSGDQYLDIFKLNKDRTEPGGARFTDPDVIEPGWELDLPNGATASAAGTTVTASPAVHSQSGGSKSGDLSDWIDEALSVLKAHGYQVSFNAIYQTAIHESDGNPDAVNHQDSNAAEGHPSIGLMQTIQPTFNEYALSGYADIYNPVDNIIAAVRYAAAAYGSLDQVVAARCGGDCWRGY